MNEQESVGRTLYDLIGGFFRRDLAYIIGGGLMIFVADIFWSPELPELSLSDYYPLAWSEGSAWLPTVVWILAAYVLGILLSEAGDFLGVINKGKTLPENYRGRDQIDFYHANEGKREALKIHERSISFLHITSSVGTALIFGLIKISVFCDLTHPGVWAGIVLVAAGLAGRWYFKSAFNFLCDSGRARFFSMSGDLLLAAGTALMGLNMLAFRPLMFLLTFLAGLIFLQLSRIFSNRVIRERETIDRLPSLPGTPSAAPHAKRKKPAK